jgi:hypothetical protein
MRASLAWAEIVQQIDRLNLTQSDSALAKAKLVEANETLKTRLKEAWCYLIYPVQESAHSDVEWISTKIPAQDGLLARASKKLVSDEAMLTDLGPSRLDRELQKYIWKDNQHLSLSDLWEYLNRYTYLPRVKSRDVLVRAVQAAVSGMLPGPFAYAEKAEPSGGYAGLLIDKAANPLVVIDSESVIVQPAIAEAHRPAPAGTTTGSSGTTAGEPPAIPATGAAETIGGAEAPVEKLPTRFSGTVMISPDRPAREIHQIVEAIVEQLTTIPGSDVTLRLEIDADVPAGLDRGKVRTLLENATTLGFIDKGVS